VNYRFLTDEAVEKSGLVSVEPAYTVNVRTVDGFFFLFMRVFQTKVNWVLEPGEYFVIVGRYFCVFYVELD